MWAVMRWVCYGFLQRAPISISLSEWKIPLTEMRKVFQRTESKSGTLRREVGGMWGVMMSRDWQKKISPFQTDRFVYVHQETCIFFLKCHQNVFSRIWIRAELAIFATYIVCVFCFNFLYLSHIAKSIIFYNRIQHRLTIYLIFHE